MDPQDRRRSILDAAMEVLAVDDIGEITFERVAEAAGVSRSLVHNYFGDRSGLLASLYLHSFSRLEAALDDAVADPAAPASDRLRAVVRAYFLYAADHPGQWRLLASTLALHHPSVVGARRRRIRRLAERWGGGPVGDVVAASVVGVLEAATVTWLDAGCTPELDVVVDAVHRMLWSGLAAMGELGLHPPAVREPLRPPRERVPSAAGGGTPPTEDR